jgi:anti-sigma B factor antagonist
MDGVELRARVSGGHIVLALHGELDICEAGDTAATITAIAGRELGREHCVIVDLEALEFIDCASLGALASAQQRARQAGGEVLLAAPAGMVARLLDLTGLGEVLGVHASVASAVASAALWRPTGRPRRDAAGVAARRPGRRSAGRARTPRPAAAGQRRRSRGALTPG